MSAWLPSVGFRNKQVLVTASRTRSPYMCQPLSRAGAFSGAPNTQNKKTNTLAMQRLAIMLRTKHHKPSVRQLTSSSAGINLPSAGFHGALGLQPEAPPRSESARLRLVSRRCLTRPGLLAGDKAETVVSVCVESSQKLLRRTSPTYPPGSDSRYHSIGMKSAPSKS